MHQALLKIFFLPAEGEGDERMEIKGEDGESWRKEKERGDICERFATMSRFFSL